MKRLAYWIQRADLSATDYEPVDVAEALHAFATHRWRDELDLLSQLETAGSEHCPPGIGFVDPAGRILHVCPGSDGCALVHFHTRSVRKAFGLIPTWQSAVHTMEGMVRADVVRLIDLFFHGQDDSILQRLGAA
jgi:hypothetical protein